MTEIRIDGLRKQYQVSGRKIQVLDHLHLTFRTDQKIVILGKSGCGKTTLLRVISGLTSYDEGNIEGRDEVRLGYIFQEARLFPWLTVRENAALSVRKGKNAKRVDQMLELTGLTEFADAYPNQLSGGMKRKAALARCLVDDPELVLMDEPFSALDYFTRNQLQDELLRIFQKEHKGMLLVTHNIEEAFKIADMICIMQNGKISNIYSMENEPFPRNLFSEEMLHRREKIINEFQEEQRIISSS